MNIHSRNFKSHLWYEKNYEVTFNQDELKGFQAHALTSTEKVANRIYALSRALLAPTKVCLKGLALALLPNPGEGKEQKSFISFKVVRLCLGTASILGLIASSVFIILCSPVHLASLWAHKQNPLIHVIYPKDLDEPLQRPVNADHVHIETQNVGFVPDFVRITNDLRPVKERSEEIAKSFREDPRQADFLCFQETFESKELRKGLKQHYPYIISDILPSLLPFSFNSGISLASKYPIEKLRVRVLNSSSGVDGWAPKSLVTATVLTPIGKMNIYTVHTQSLVGKKEAQIRFDQIQQVKRCMQKDFEADGVDQVLTGDFNTGTKNLWGQSNLHEKNPELIPLTELETFTDPFLKDHDRLTGNRTKGQAQFLKFDNAAMKVELPEPKGSWNHGPYADKTTLLGYFAHKKLKKTSTQCGYSHEKIEQNIPSWGTKRWFNDQHAETRLDYILFPKNQNLDAAVEIRRSIVPQGSSSSASDHNRVAAIIMRKK